MTKVPYNGEPVRRRAGRRLHRRPVRDPAAERGRARPLAPAVPVGPGRVRPRRHAAVYLACRLIVTLPVEEGGPDVEAVYEDLGEMDAGSLAGLKALYSDARKRAARRRRDRRLPVHLARGGRAADRPERQAGAGDPPPGQERPARRSRRRPSSGCATATRQRMSTEAVRRDLGEILAHGEPENGIGQGEVADQAAQPTTEPPAAEPASAGDATGTARS